MRRPARAERPPKYPDFAAWLAAIITCEAAPLLGRDAAIAPPDGYYSQWVRGIVRDALRAVLAAPEVTP